MLKFHGNIDHAMEKLKSGREAKAAIAKNSIPMPRKVLANSQTIFTQPQFYSPLHTPQNWQMPSKRREVYQWLRYWVDNEPKVAAAIDFYCFDPNTPVLLKDGSQKAIAEVEVGTIVRSHDGSANKVVKKYERHVSENMLNIFISGISKPLKTTKEHKILVEKNGSFEYVRANTLTTGDQLLTPVDQLLSSGRIEHLSVNDFTHRNIEKIEEYFYDGKVFDMEVEGVHSYVANGVSVHNCGFPMNGFTLQCKNGKVKKFFDNFVREINLEYWCKLISKEYYMLGDVFPFMEISCKKCFTEDTFVLTNKGNKRITDIKVGDFVLTKSGNFEEVIRHISLKNSDNLVSLKATSLPSLVSTPDHKHFIVRPEFRPDNRVKSADWGNPIEVEAKDIKIGDYLMSPFGVFLPNDCKKILFDGSIFRIRNKELSTIKEIELTEEFAELIGWYVAEGSTDQTRRFAFSLNNATEQEAGARIAFLVKKYFGLECKIESHFIGNSLNVNGYSTELSRWFDFNCGHGSDNKKIPHFIMNAPENIKKAFIRGYWLGDGHDRRNEFSTTTVSRNLCFDMIAILFNLGITCNVSEKQAGTDNLGIHRRHSYTVVWQQNKKRNNGQGTKILKDRAFFKIREIHNDKKAHTVYNMTVENNHDYVANMFHTKNCGGSGITKDNKVCNHPGGDFSRLVVLNPDWIDVQKNVLADAPVITLIPDEEIKRIVWHKKPIEIYNRLPMHVKQAVMAGKPIPLHNDCVSHLKYHPSAYGVYGTSIIRRLFKILTYKDKLMTAQWTVAERLILPIRVVKVGNDERPAGEADIADVQEQLAQTANDPNLTLVTHHAFDYDWIGCLSTDDNNSNVLCADGVKHFRDLTENDLIATWSEKTGLVEYQKYIRKVEFKYDSSNSSGVAYKIHTNKYSFLTTPNHRHYMDEGAVKRSDELAVGDLLLKQDKWKWEGAIPKEIILLKVGELDETFRITKIEPIPYDGNMWCLEMPNRNFFLRAGNQIILTGNTSGKVLTLSNEFDLINKEILQGLMLNEALLSGEMGGYQCNSFDTKTLCKSGFKLFDDITSEDEIACVNKDTGGLEYHKPTATFCKDYEGDLVHFQTDRIDIAVTPNHRMLYKKRSDSSDPDTWHVGRADEIAPKMRFRKNVKWMGEEPAKFIEIIGAPTILINDYLEIGAFYVTEGYVRHGTNESKATFGQPVSAVIYQTEKGKAWKEVNALVQRCAITGHHYNYGHGDEFVFSNKKLATRLEDEFGCGSFEKKLPLWIKNLPYEYLYKFLMDMIKGDGSHQTRNGKDFRYCYLTVSDRLKDDVMEIALKCGYTPKAVKRVARGKSSAIWQVYFSDLDRRQDDICLDSRKYDCITKMPYKGKVFCFTVPTGFFITERNGKIAIQGNSSAIGAESLIQRMESWRLELAHWIEERVFKPLCQMKGFVDEEESKQLGKPCWIPITIKWNDLNLRDDTQQKQLWIQLYDKQAISLQSLLEKFGMDYNHEVERQRWESVLQQVGQQQQQGGAGGAGGDMGGGAGGAAPPPDMGGAPPPGGDMGGAGAPMGGDMGGGAPTAASAASGLGGSGNKILTRNKASKAQKPMSEEVAAPTRQHLTTLEQEMYKVLVGMNIPFRRFVQYPLGPYRVDFAIPELKLAIECDGDQWHNLPDDQARDAKKDMTLARFGWTTVRYDETNLKENLGGVQKSLVSLINKLWRDKADEQKNPEGEKKLSEFNRQIIKIAGINPDDCDDFSISEMAKSFRLISGAFPILGVEAVTDGEIKYSHSDLWLEWYKKVLPEKDEIAD